ncbi:LLM class flavin-dependent oxidoreductase [Actinoallomurus iriomotensis]|uniref:LLM class F420-dependent oxidoreductase n=1 Tax=Actinoallomurus iriomotensis TaxID=478107 RepID=A0A9W6S3I7_9ACTN|nr:LLM class flavin-dependent oxidoreductase [Actinoallomurus iriomotensis]GLY85107.1 LLM class F420-dependent oxidoreductase [Actinoallomurus iriomotensis]
MKLGVNLVHDGATVVACEAERLGYESALVAEGYRSDAATVLGMVAGATRRLGLVSSVFQIPARTPGLTALTASTLDAVSGGRFRLGLGISNPDVSEGWYGVPFDAPLARTREYVDVVRAALRREPVRYQGTHVRLPPTGRTGEPLRLFTEPVRADLPIYLAAVGPRNLRLAGEIADGWIATFCSPARVSESVAVIAESRAAARRSRPVPADGAGDGFEVIACVPVAPAGDVRTAADAVRPYLAHFLGMGSFDRNFYCAVAEQMGFGHQAMEVHQRVQRGDRRGAAGAVPFAFIDEISILGPVGRIAGRMKEYAAAGVTTLGVSAFAPTTDGRCAILRAAREACDVAGLDH